jgi:DNA-binding beta-propeller fold protein YncE
VVRRAVVILLVAGCSGGNGSTDGSPTAPTVPVSGIPILGDGTHSLDHVTVTTIGTGADDGLDTPTDLAFHPDVTDELWVVNQKDESVTLFSATGTADQASRVAKHATGEHFLASPAGIAFGDNGLWASIHDHDEATQGGATGPDFMGPTLWTGDSEIFEGGDVSHLDMLHNSPKGKGIAWSGPGNLYWVYDGEHKSLTRYDFNDDHGLGGTDHTDGEIVRFVEGELNPHRSLPSHLEMDRDTDLLYVADPGNDRIAVLDTATGERGDLVGPNFDGVDQYEMVQATTSTLVDTAALGMGTPVGIALHDGLLWVSAVEPHAIYAFELDGTMVDYLDLDREPSGIEFNVDGSLYFVSAAEDEVVRIEAHEG